MFYDVWFFGYSFHLFACAQAMNVGVYWLDMTQGRHTFNFHLFLAGKLEMWALDIIFIFSLWSSHVFTDDFHQRFYESDLFLYFIHFKWYLKATTSSFRLSRFHGHRNFIMCSQGRQHASFYLCIFSFYV